MQNLRKQQDMSLNIASQIVNSTTPKSLTKITNNPTIQWTPILVNKILKRLWNHAPKALQFFTHLLRHSNPTFSPSASSFNHAIDLSARLKQYSTLHTLLSQMHSLRLGPNPETIAIITERYVAVGKAERAVRLFSRMGEYGVVVGVKEFNTMLDVLCKGRRVEKAAELFRILKGRFGGGDRVSYNVIANGWCLVKRPNKALEVFREMVDRGIGGGDGGEGGRMYNVVLKGYFRAGMIEEGWRFFKEMKKRGVEIDVFGYTTVVYGLGVAGEVARARKVFDGMVDDGVLPSVVTYNALIQVLCKKDSVENAIGVFDEMVRKGYEPNVVTYNAVVRGLCHVGEFGRALGFVDRMREDGCEPNVQTFNVVIRYFCDDGEIERGLELFEKMNDGSCLPNLDTYNVLISALFVRKKSNDLVMAGKLLIEMVDRGFLPRKLMFSRIVDGLSLTGNHEFARQILSLQSRCGKLPRQFKL